MQQLLQQLLQLLQQLQPPRAPGSVVQLDAMHMHRQPYVAQQAGNT
jgi:hypothetical protein